MLNPEGSESLRYLPALRYGEDNKLDVYHLLGLVKGEKVLKLVNE